MKGEEGRVGRVEKGKEREVEGREEEGKTAEGREGGRTTLRTHRKFLAKPLPTSTIHFLTT